MFTCACEHVCACERERECKKGEGEERGVCLFHLYLRANERFSAERFKSVGRTLTQNQNGCAHKHSENHTLSLSHSLTHSLSLSHTHKHTLSLSLQCAVVKGIVIIFWSKRRRRKSHTVARLETLDCSWKWFFKGEAHPEKTKANPKMFGDMWHNKKSVKGQCKWTEN